MSGNIWLKRVLIPPWVVQLAVLVVLVGVSAFALSTAEDISEYEEFEETNDSVINAIDAAAAMILSFAVFTILLDVVEIGLATGHRLKPAVNLVMQCIKSAIWTVYFVLVIVGAAVSGGGGSGLSIFLALLMFLTCIALLVYGSVILHRCRKGNFDRYNTSLGEVGRQGSYNIAYNHAAPVYKGPDTAGAPQLGSGGVYEMHNDPFRH